MNTRRRSHRLTAWGRIGGAALLALSLLACPGGRAPDASSAEKGQAPAVALPSPASAPADAAAKKDAEVPSEEASLRSAKVFFLSQPNMETGEEPLLKPVERRVSRVAPAKGALDALFQGPTSEEAARGLRLVASGATGFTNLRIEEGVAHVQLVGGCNSGGSTISIANLIQATLRQFPTVRHVKLYDPAGQTQESAALRDSIPACLEP